MALPRCSRALVSGRKRKIVSKQTKRSVMSNTRSGVVGIIAVIISFLALLSVLIGPGLRDALFPKPPIEERIGEKAAAIRDSVIASLKGEPRKPTPAQARFDRENLPYTISLGLAGLGIIGGSISYLRREDRRLAYVACGIGTLTLAWHAILIALGALIVCVLLFLVISAVLGGVDLPAP